QTVAALAVLATSWAAAAPISAQETPPLVRGLVTGYGTISYSAEPDNDYANNFIATLSPMLLHQVGSDLLMEAEADLELEDASTSLHLEHAMIHYLGFERVRLTAGMFHLPFGMWHHATWVNKMPTPPLLYEDTHGAPTHDALMPILFDVGAMASFSPAILDHWTTSADVWVSQGPSDEIEPHVHGAAEDTTMAVEPHSDAAALGYGATFEDNNSNKMVGLRLRAISHGGLMVQAAGFTAKYDAASDLGVRGANVSLMVAPRAADGSALFDLRGEAILLGQDFIDDEEGVKDRAISGGYYAQLSKRVNEFEPVARWSQLPQALAGEGALVESRRQLALGVNYWFTPSVPLKAAYNIELDGTDAFFIEWTVGF
ncbi:MAG: hypothetical protein PVH96_06380, partial [Gemmatimonadota bacterium]